MTIAPNKPVDTTRRPATLDGGDMQVLGNELGRGAAA